MWRTLFTIAALAAGVLGQRTLIVDWTGAGGAFPDLPQAIAAAQDGDIVLVRRGTYPAPVGVTKAVSILCDPSVTLNSIGVTNIAAGKRFTLRGARFQERFDNVHWWQPGVVQVDDCAGHVHLEDLVGDYVTSGSRCSQISLQNCVTSWGFGFSRCTAVVTDCHAGPQNADQATFRFAQMALGLADSDVTLVVTVQGSPLTDAEAECEGIAARCWAAVRSNGQRKTSFRGSALALVRSSLPLPFVSPTQSQLAAR